jgi:hypothetical protein
MKVEICTITSEKSAQQLINRIRSCQDSTIIYLKYDDRKTLAITKTPAEVELTKLLIYI